MAHSMRKPARSELAAVSPSFEQLLDTDELRLG